VKKQGEGADAVQIFACANKPNWPEKGAMEMNRVEQHYEWGANQCEIKVRRERIVEEKAVGGEHQERGCVASLGKGWAKE
jgi:hypothetical protein